MRLEYYPVEKLKKEILEIVGRHLDLARYRVFFFGSRVAGQGTDRSDVDIGIEGGGAVPLSKLSAIEEEIENLPTLYKIDVADFSLVTAKFKEVACRHIETINID